MFVPPKLAACNHQYIQFNTIYIEKGFSLIIKFFFFFNWDVPPGEETIKFEIEKIN